jgi:hypothetical protein
VQDAASRFEGIEGFADLQEVPQVAAFDEFHCEIVEPALSGDFKDRNHVRMHKFLTDTGLTLKRGHGARIVRPALTQQLQGHNLTRLDVFCAKDSSKTAGGIAVEQFVTAQYQPLGFTLQYSAALQ